MGTLRERRNTAQRRQIPPERGNRGSGELATAGHRSSLAELDTLDLHALRREWTQLFGKKAPSGRCLDVLRRGIAWRQQEKAESGLSASAGQQLTRLTAALGRNPDYQVGSDLKAGTTLVREWQGTRHEVRVLEEGFEHGGKRHRSLSAIARHITGTRWNGPLFFGLKKANGSG